MAKKSNGEGSISFETSLNKYRAAITDPNGKRRVKRFAKKADAVQWLTEIKTEIYKDSYITPSDLTVGEWLSEYLATYAAPNVRPSTLKRYAQTAAHISPIANITIQSLTAHTVQKFYNNLPDMSDSSKLKIHKLLKMVLAKAYQLEHTNKDIMKSVIAPKQGERKEIEIFTQRETESILKTCLETNPKYYTFLIFAFATGVRIGEILGLKTDALHNGYVHIKNSLMQNTIIDLPPKTKAGNRKVTVSAKVMAMLHAESDPSVSEYVFHTKNGTAWQHRNVERAWKVLLERAGVEYKTFHCIRHTHATRLLADGVPLLEVAKRLGHSKATHTLTLYGHAVPGYDLSLPDKIDNLFFKDL